LLFIFFLKMLENFPQYKKNPPEKNTQKIFFPKKKKTFFPPPPPKLIECFMQKRVKYHVAYSCVAGSKLTSNRKPTVTNTKDVVDGIALEYHEFHK